MRSRHSLPQVSNKGIDLVTLSAAGCKRLKSGQIGYKRSPLSAASGVFDLTR